MQLLSPPHQLTSAALLAIACAAPLAAAASASNLTSPEVDSLARPSRLIEVHGHRMNLHCSGHGSPTVVFDAASGDPGWVWWSVQPPIAAKTRACVFDRPGLGFSETSDRPATSAEAAQALHTLLAAAGVAPPYVLVGNSMGGIDVQLFAYSHPDDVAGLVLVEASPEDEDARLDKVSDGKMSMLNMQSDQAGRACVEAAKKGFAADSEAAKACVGEPDPALPPAIRGADFQARQTASAWIAARREHDALPEDHAQLRGARKFFGALPIIVLVRGVSPYSAPGKPPSATSQAVEAENLAMQTEVSKQSTNAELRVIAGAGHIVQADRPDAVIQAITDMLARVKK